MSSVPQLESVVVPDGGELLQDFLHLNRPHNTEQTLIDQEGEESGLGEEDVLFVARAKRPWWRRPSPWWSV